MKREKIKCFHFTFFFLHNIELKFIKHLKLKKSYNGKVIQRLIINIFIILLKILFK